MRCRRSRSKEQRISHLFIVVKTAFVTRPSTTTSYWYGPVFVGWLYADGKLTRFLERLLLLIYTTVFGLLAGIGGFIYAFSKMTDAHLDPQGVMHRLATLPPSMQIVVLVCLVYTFMVFFSETILLSTVGAVIVAAHVLLLILELVLKILRAFAWRVVEYNKGASPAILLVLTSVIGLLKLYLGQH